MMPVVAISAGEAVNGIGIAGTELSDVGPFLPMLFGMDDIFSGHVAKAEMAPEAVHIGVAGITGNDEPWFVRLSCETVLSA